MEFNDKFRPAILINLCVFEQRFRDCELKIIRANFMGRNKRFEAEV